MECCILIPARNEAQVLPQTIEMLYQDLPSDLSFNILVVNDHSTDDTEKVLGHLKEKYAKFDFINNKNNGGVGNAISYGLDIWNGDVVSICMADGSDSPEDVAIAFKLMENENLDCVFGTRFGKLSQIKNYPLIKFILNRIFNNLVRLCYAIDYNDFTNLFKVYNRRAIQSIKPLESSDFSIGLEMCLKAYNSNLNIHTIPIAWEKRAKGKSKLKIKDNISSYIQVFWENRNTNNIY